ncbi:hypothetical protein ACFOZ1_15895 [Gracilibacillus marinus]|uniref:Uncharacterized protein n=1 Tax=Gracilibacillus marinus TaxID=630535 RepID=A0ABV8VXM1_9BACI
MIKNIYEKVSKIKKADSEDKIKLELYGVISSLLLSGIFEKNSEIKDFLENSNDKFKEEIKPYVYLSKTLIIGRISREIEKESKLFNYNFALDIKAYIENWIKETDDSDVIEEPNKKSDNLKKDDIKKKNYTDALFDRFKRGE